MKDDVASPPTLIDYPVKGGARDAIPAVAQATKRGQIFILDRLTGKATTTATGAPRISR